MKAKKPRGENQFILLTEAYVGGVRTHLNMLMRYLVSQGFSVRLICSSRDEEVDYSYDPGVADSIEDVTKNHKHSLLKRIIFFKQVYSLSQKWDDNTVIHAHGFLAFLILICLKMIGLKNILLVTLHGGPLHRKGIYQKLLRIIMPFISQYVSSFVCVSEHDKNLQLQVNVPENLLVVIENAIDIERIQKALSTQTNPFAGSTKISLVIVSTLYKTKGVWELLVNLNNDPIFDPDKYCLYLIGAGPQKNKTDRFIAESSYLSSLVYSLGHVPVPYNYMKWADVVLFPSRGETFGLVLFEALYVGASVIAHHQPITDQYLEETNLANFDDVKELNQKVEALLKSIKNEDYSKLLSEKCDSFYETYRALYLSFLPENKGH